MQLTPCNLLKSSFFVTRLPCGLPGAPSSIIRVLSDPPRSQGSPQVPVKSVTLRKTHSLSAGQPAVRTLWPLAAHGLFPSVFFLLQGPLLRYPDDHHATDADPGGIFSLLRPPPRHGRGSCRVGAFSDRCRSKGSRFTSMATIDPFLFKAKKTCPEPSLRAGIRTCCT